MSRGSSDVTDALRAAIRRDELQLAFQPEYELGTSTVVAVEALARWEHPSRGTIAPADFVALAEESDLILELGGWVLETALRELARWIADLPDIDILLRFNAARAQLIRPDYVDGLRAALDRFGVEPGQVCVEITEGGPRDGLDKLATSIGGLRELGVQVAIDDLANGYSTLGMLRSYPVDIVKIDRALVGDVDADERAAAIVGAVVRLTDALGVTLVAEGIETQAESDALVRLGCRHGQGYLMSRPMTGPEIADCLRGQARRRASG